MAALPVEKDVQTPVAEPPADGSQLPQPRPGRLIIRPSAAIAHRAAVHADRSARPPLAHLIGQAKVSHRLSSCDGRHHFFAAISFNMTLSSIASARSFFSFEFSISRTFSRRASDTSSPPYFAFHL